MKIPRFLRLLIPWKLLLWIDKRYDYCWCDLVAWKLGYTDKWGRANSKCFVRTNKIHPIFDAFDVCYCCKYPMGVKHVYHDEEAYFIHRKGVFNDNP